MSTPDGRDLMRRAEALPCWRGPATAEPLAGGLTNANFLVRDRADRYVVRIGGDIPVHQVLRFNELAASRAAAAAGLAPEVVHAEPGVLVLHFVDGRTLGPADFADAGILSRVAELLRRCHREVALHLRGPVVTFWPFHIVRDYAATLRAGGSAWTGELPRLLGLADRLARALGPVEIAFTHNDLLAANIIDDGARLWLIDWEYAGFGAAAFDLANLATNNGLDRDRERALLAHYFGRAPDAHELRAHAIMRAASLLREAMWGMVSEIHSTLDVDYRAYAADHLARLEVALSELPSE